jgi:hypothetical protein
MLPLRNSAIGAGQPTHDCEIVEDFYVGLSAGVSGPRTVSAKRADRKRLVIPVYAASSFRP